MADEQRNDKESTTKKMKIVIGGTMGFKIQGNSYESINADTYFTIEKEVDADFPKEALRKFFDKTNKILEEEAVKKMKIAYDTYRKKINNIKNSV